MKDKNFLLILFFSIIFKTQVSFADEAKMAKGLEIFNETAGCAACHILKAAGSEGNIGPNLDTVAGLTQESVKDIVTHGLGVMPAFAEAEILTEEEIDIVSFYVANSAGK
jgi:mono/diheme cytochrome c family protein